MKMFQILGGVKSSPKVSPSVYFIAERGGYICSSPPSLLTPLMRRITGFRATKPDVYIALLILALLQATQKSMFRFAQVT